MRLRRTGRTTRPWKETNSTEELAGLGDGHYLKQPESDDHEEHLEEGDENVGLRIGEQDEGQHGADAAVEHRGPDVFKGGNHPLVPLYLK